jgi:hypothetical protein
MKASMKVIARSVVLRLPSDLQDDNAVFLLEPVSGVWNVIALTT